MTEITNREEDRCRFFTRLNEKEYPCALRRYRRAEEYFPEDTFFTDTGGAGCTETFRSYLKEYIDRFVPERFGNERTYLLALDKEGQFKVYSAGHKKRKLSKPDRTLYHYLCFIHTAEFWQGFERIRNLGYKPKPLIVENRFDETNDLKPFIDKAKGIGREVIIKDFSVIKEGQYMKKLRILYVHGYMGSENGSASQLIRAELDRRGINYTLNAPQFDPTDPEGMKKDLERYMEEADLVIASSMGAFYVMQATGPTRILINPALPANLKKIHDEKPESNPKLTEELLKTLQTEIDRFFEKGIDEESISQTYLVFGTRDTVAGNEEEFCKYYIDDSHIFHVDMEHKVDASGAKTVCDIIERLIN